MKLNHAILLSLFCVFLFACKENNEKLIDRGVYYQNKGDYKKAISLYTKAIKRNNKLQLAYYNRGICYSQLNLYNDALNDFNTILRLKTPVGNGDYIFEMNPNSPFADEEDRAQADYHDVLYQRAQVKFFMDSLQSSYYDFAFLANRNYKWKVFCILFQANIWHYLGKDEKACEFAQNAKIFAITEGEVKQVTKAQKSYCKKIKLQ